MDITRAIQFFALFMLMLVTGIFWGPLYSLHRSLRVFNAEEFIHIVKTMAANLAVPMRIMMPSCILLLLLSIWTYPQYSLGFYLSIASFILMLVSLIITILIEVPIVSQITKWTAETIPANWELIRDRWVRFHVVRTSTALVSFGCFAASVIIIS
jgi:uncharacterized membrane protein